VWFTSFANQRLGRLADGELDVISSTAHGDLWISEFSTNRLTRLDIASGNPVASVALPANASEPLNVTSDSAGILWYAAQHGAVGRGR
jgi:streptogramin lyase